MRARLRGPGGWAFGLTVAGFGWSLFLIAAAFVVPVYSGESSSSSSSGTSTTHALSSSTLVQENGLGVLVPLAIPALLAAVTWYALHRKCSRSNRWSGSVAWAAIVLLGFFALLTSWSIGLFLMPTCVLLAVAAALTPARAP